MFTLVRVGWQDVGAAAANTAPNLVFFGKPKKGKTASPFSGVINNSIKQITMKKIVDKETFKTKRITIRFSPSEFKRMMDKAKKAGTNPANYCREVSINGLITEKANPYDLNEVRLLKQLLINYKTNFSRISNLISISNPRLYDEVREVKNRIEETLKRFNHDSKSKEQP